MHCLTGTYITQMAKEVGPDQGNSDIKCGNEVFYPVKIVLPPFKSRILYFKSKHE